MLRSYFIRKLEFLKIDWGQKSRHFLTLGEIMGRMGEMSVSVFQVHSFTSNFWLQLHTGWEFS